MAHKCAIQGHMLDPLFSPLLPAECPRERAVFLAPRSPNIDRPLHMQSDMQVAALQSRRELRNYFNSLT